MYDAEKATEHTMKAMVLHDAGQRLVLEKRSIPKPDDEEILVRVLACAVCRTDLHVVDGDLPNPKLPLIPGHEIIGEVVDKGTKVSDFDIGDRVGIPWLGSTCGQCTYCVEDRENLCDAPKFTGYTRDGGFAEYTLANPRFCFSVSGDYSDVAAAPLMCAGLIGFRSYRKIGDAQRVGLYGFGAAAHILIQIAVHQGRKVFAFTKPGDEAGQAFARSLGAVWAGASDELPPEKLDAAIIFAPVGPLVPQALRVLDKGGIVVCAGIHMSDIPGFPYKDLWEERRIVSVANLTRQDGIEFLDLAPKVPVQTTTKVYPLEKVNEALDDLRAGRIEGAAVIVMGQNEP